MENKKMMKIATIALLMNVMDLQFDFLPKVALLAMMFFAMVIDFITGVTKAYVLKQRITSKALRRTVIKFSQYGGAILIGLGLSYMTKLVSEYNPTWKYSTKFMSFCNNSLLVFIILIEFRSIIENLAGMDKTSRISKSLFSPALKILDIQINNNPVTKLTIETEEEVEIKTQESIKSKNPKS